MKFSNILNLALMGFAAAAPTPTVDDNTTGVLEKRASITESCNIGYGSGTTGGKGGSTTTVSTLAQFTKAAEASGKRNIVVKGTINGSYKVRVASDKTIVGTSGSKLVGVGLYINKVNNVIVRNMRIQKVKDANGDAVGVQASTKVWIDHCDLSSSLGDGKDTYDGLIDITHGSDLVTVSNTFLHDHWKTTLIGHTDSSTVDKKTKVTYAGNHFENVNSRNPLVRHATVHLYNNYFNKLIASGVNSRMGAQVRVESSVWENSHNKAIISEDSKEVGYVTVSDVSYGGSKNTAPAGSFGSSKIPYSYSLYGRNNVKSRVVGTAGQTLKF